MDLRYISTRGKAEAVSASVAVINGLCSDGGLYVPESIPRLSVGLDKLAELDYKETAYLVLKEFMTDYTEDELKHCINMAYDEKFDTPEIAPVKVGDEYSFLELFHGKTIAFKDMALSLLPHLLTTALKKNHIEEEVVILTATSGDTGKAALAGFADVEGTRIIVFYPKGGVSRFQELQMVTQKGKNVSVSSVKGNFDDCQSGVKNIFNDEEFRASLKEKGYILSSANSINIGRLFPQVAYYVYAYGRMVKNGSISCGDELNVSVPTGNFGNILAAYYAKQMGIPLGKLICASNENNVLYDFFKSGTYDKNREFILTSSPSMDILISSNLERLIYYLAGRDCDKTAAFMADLSKQGKYTLDKSMMDLAHDFVPEYATEDEVAATIHNVNEWMGYVIDPHTAVATAAASMYKSVFPTDNTPCLVVSTASPYKFTKSVMKAVDDEKPVYSTEGIVSLDDMDDFELIDKLHEISGVDIPNAVEEIRSAKILHDNVCEKEEMKAFVEKTLNK